jgi:hypothetical protein
MTGHPLGSERMPSPDWVQTTGTHPGVPPGVRLSSERATVRPDAAPQEAVMNAGEVPGRDLETAAV